MEVADARHGRTMTVQRDSSHDRPDPVRPRVRVDQLNKVFRSSDSDRTVLGSVSFEVGQGEYVSVVGSSGSGKTTVLRCIAGLLAPTSGTVYVDEEPVAGPPDKLALVFQDYSRSLLPWLTVVKNVMLPLRGKGIDRAMQRDRAHEALTAVGLVDAMHQYPWQLSGGMQQRVAIARALAYQPEALVMDEPFASVDAQTRADLEDLVLRLRRQYGMTVISVTHDIDEAVYMSDRVVVLSKRPTAVSQIVDIPLGESRDQITTKSDPLFAQLRAQVLVAVRH
ncbi:MAG TPA: ABC transporter ATP-binding protein [Kribbella sp.]